jgi:hypothetical protein
VGGTHEHAIALTFVFLPGETNSPGFLVKVNPKMFLNLASLRAKRSNLHVDLADCFVLARRRWAAHLWWTLLAMTYLENIS